MAIRMPAVRRCYNCGEWPEDVTLHPDGSVRGVHHRCPKAPPGPPNSPRSYRPGEHQLPPDFPPERARTTPPAVAAPGIGDIVAWARTNAAHFRAANQPLTAEGLTLLAAEVERHRARERTAVRAAEAARSALDRQMGDTDPADPDDPRLLACQALTSFIEGTTPGQCQCEDFDPAPDGETCAACRLPIFRPKPGE